MSLTVDDKLRVAEQLDHLGVAYIEGGWPGANPKDEEFFARAAKELQLQTATLVAFGSTRRSGVPGRQRRDAPPPRRRGHRGRLHRRQGLRPARHRGAADDARRGGRDGGRLGRRTCARRASASSSTPSTSSTATAADADFALRVLAAAEEAGAETLVLCDTNGGTLPDEVGEVVADVRARSSATIGAHFHNDGGCAVANTLAAVRQGATQVQGCVNGYGERTGNADLSAAIANLTLKMGVKTIPADRLERLTPVAHHIAELVNLTLDPQRPYVGTAAFAHKAGLHTSALVRRSDAYEHVPPDLVGNGTRVVVSELAGRSTLQLKAAELGLELDSPALGRVLDTLKHLEHAGYHFEVADGSLELLMRAAAGEPGGGSATCSGSSRSG